MAQLFNKYKKVVYLPIALYHYMRHEESLLHQTLSKRMFDEYYNKVWVKKYYEEVNPKWTKYAEAQLLRLCYRHVFHQPLKKYFLTYAIYTFVAVFSLAISIVVCRSFYFENLFVQAILNGVFTLLIVTLSYVMAFGKTTPFIQLLVYSRSIISRFR